MLVALDADDTVDLLAPVVERSKTRGYLIHAKSDD